MSKICYCGDCINNRTCCIRERACHPEFIVSINPHPAFSSSTYNTKLSPSNTSTERTESTPNLHTAFNYAAKPLSKPHQGGCREESTPNVHTAKHLSKPHQGGFREEKRPYEGVDYGKRDSRDQINRNFSNNGNHDAPGNQRMRESTPITPHPTLKPHQPNKRDSMLSTTSSCSSYKSSATNHSQSSYYSTESYSGAKENTHPRNGNDPHCYPAPIKCNFPSTEPADYPRYNPSVPKKLSPYHHSRPLPFAYAKQPTISENGPLIPHPHRRESATAPVITAAQRRESAPVPVITPAQSQRRESAPGITKAPVLKPHQPVTRLHPKPIAEHPPDRHSTSFPPPPPPVESIPQTTSATSKTTSATTKTTSATTNTTSATTLTSSTKTSISSSHPMFTSPFYSTMKESEPVKLSELRRDSLPDHYPEELIPSPDLTSSPDQADILDKAPVTTPGCQPESKRQSSGAVHDLVHGGVQEILGKVQEVSDKARNVREKAKEMLGKRRESEVVPSLLCTASITVLHTTFIPPDDDHVRLQ